MYIDCKHNYYTTGRTYYCNYSQVCLYFFFSPSISACSGVIFRVQLALMHSLVANENQQREGENQDIEENEEITAMNSSNINNNQQVGLSYDIFCILLIYWCVCFLQLSQIQTMLTTHYLVISCRFDALGSLLPNETNREIAKMDENKQNTKSIETTNLKKHV